MLMNVTELAINDTYEIDLHIQTNQKNYYLHPQFHLKIFNNSFVRDSLFNYDYVYYANKNKDKNFKNLLCIQMPSNLKNSKCANIILITNFYSEEFLNSCIAQFQNTYVECNKISLLCKESDKKNKYFKKVGFKREINYLNGLNSYSKIL